MRTIGTMHEITLSKLANMSREQELFAATKEKTKDLLKLQESLKISEARLTAALETIDEGFVIYDSDDRLVLCNAKYLEIYTESADLLVPSAKFEEIIREGLKRDQYPEALGREEEWIADRMVNHLAGNRNSDTCMKFRYQYFERIHLIFERKIGKFF